jgi:SAM-dependent methyltransferase
MQEFWDERARENAPYFVENTLDYADPNLDRFWQSGVEAVDAILGRLGLAVGADDVVVDLGCGLGRLTRVLAERALRVMALDVSEEMLRQAREHNAHLDNVEWIHCDGRSLTGVGDASATGFFSHVVFQHIPDPAITYAYVADVGRVLRPGGWAAFQVSNDPSVHRPQSGLPMLRHRLRAAVGRAPKGSTHPAWLGSAVDLGVLRRTAEGAGLEVTRITGEGTQFCMVALRRT